MLEVDPVSVTVIAEPGCTHEGSYESMVRLIHVAADAGCDVFKNQWMSDPDEVCRMRKAPNYLPFYRWLDYPLSWHASLARACRESGMAYACSTYTAEDRAAVDDFVSLHKIASFENEKRPSEAGKPVLIGAGMLTHEELLSLTFDSVGVLQCTSSYPAPLESLQLATIPYYGLAGLSDHSRDLDIGAFAVCAGAQFIEVHMRLDDCDPKNPDYAVAFSPSELTAYVAKIRKAERAMGDPVKRIHPCEQDMLRYKVKVNGI